MSTYSSLEKLIDNAIEKCNKGIISPEDYELFKKDTLKKMDMFLIMDRLTVEQYKELSEKFKSNEN